MTRRFSKIQRPRSNRCGRGCRRIGLDEMIHAFPEKLSGSKTRRRQAA